MDAAKTIFIEALLPDRKLRSFEQQPLHQAGPGRDGSMLLLCWHIEDALKKRYGMKGQACHGGLYGCLT